MIVPGKFARDFVPVFEKGVRGLRRSTGSRMPLVAGLLLSLSLVVAACGGGGEQGGGEAVSGEISIQGSSTVQPITQAAAELFREQNPDARISVGGAGTSDGFEVCEENGVEFIEIPVAFDGISVVVNKQNGFASAVTSEQLKTLWEPAAEGKINRWNQLNPQWPDEEISLYGPGTESGTYEFFNETIVGNEEEVNRSDYEASEDDNVLVQGVSGDGNALGYFGYSYYENNRDSLEALAVDGVEPSQDSIRSGEYLLSRPLFIYVSAKALKNNDAVKPFVDFYVSEGNLNRLVSAAKYVTLPGSLAQESRAQYQDRTTGTVFNAEGEPKGGDLEAALQRSQ